MSKVYIVAEAGVNHNGNSDLAFQLVDAAVEAGADAVKFQTFKAEKIVTKQAVKAEYQQKTTEAKESQFNMLKRLELTHEMHYKLAEYCKLQGITFLSTAFDLDSLDFLVNNLSIKTLKIPSGEINNGPLVLAHAQTKCDLIVSTGMATLDEIEDVLGVIAFGMLYGKDTKVPSRTAFQEAYSSPQAQKILKEKVTLLHCTTEYPAPFEDINLNAIKTMHNTFGLKTGYSDHSKGITVSIAAASLGAVLVEKHFTLDRSFSGPDHQASLEPAELKKMVIAIREIELAMGDGLKDIMPSELKNRTIARKSLVAASEINKGDYFSNNNLTVKRPGYGISPMDYWDILNTKSKQDYGLDDVIC